MSAWTGSAARMDAARQRVAVATADVARRPDDPATALALLEAWGSALACGAIVELGDAGRALTPEQVKGALAHGWMDLAAVEDGGIAIVEALDEDDDDGAATEAVLAGALEARDRVEHVLLGVARAAPTAPGLTVDQEIALVEFDHLVRPLLFRLTAFNGLRGEHATAVAPTHRARFWWWCEGVAIAPDAVASLAAVAELVVRFPDARARFDALVGVATLRAGATARPAAKVTRIADWIARRRTGSLLAVAAASTHERIVVQSTDAWEVSWRPPDEIVVDMHVDPRPGETPRARLPSGRVVVAALVPRTVHRYSVVLDGDALAEGECTIVIPLPLPGGDVEVVFPPSDQ